MQDPRKQKKGFDPAAFQAAAKAGQQQAYLQQNLDPDTKAKLEAVLNDNCLLYTSPSPRDCS